jgi:hypothetical protein
MPLRANIPNERRLEECRTSAVTLLLSIEHNTEWEECIDILELAKTSINDAITAAEEGRDIDEGP